MKTILKFSFFAITFACFNLVNAQPPDDPGGDPCPGWPNCDSARVSVKVLKSDISSVSVNEVFILLGESNFPVKDESPELLTYRLTAILHQEEI